MYRLHNVRAGYVLYRALVVWYYMGFSSGGSSGSGGSGGVVAVCLDSVIDGTGLNPFYVSFFLAPLF